ncbi:ComFC Predicted amidophosphoribosyltransferases [Candidatus Nanopelagicaceae bacterium]
MNLFSSLSELVFPSRCLGCGALGLEICSNCRRQWHPHLYKRWSDLSPSFPIFSAIKYSPIAGRVLLAAKESNLKVADDLIFKALSHSLEKCIDEIGTAFLLPIPSRKSVSRLRGRQFILDLSERLSLYSGAPTFNNLEHTRKVRDQSTLDLRGRRENLEGALKSQGYLSGRAILVDDLVTTRATLNEAARALRQAGIEVAAAVTACVAQPLR